MAWYSGLYYPSNHSVINPNAVENHIKTVKTHITVSDQFEERCSTWSFWMFQNLTHMHIRAYAYAKVHSESIQTPLLSRFCYVTALFYFILLI